MSLGHCNFDSCMNVATKFRNPVSFYDDIWSVEKFLLQELIC